MKGIVLAAGKGTRLNSQKENIPKVLREINDRCLVDYCLDSISFIKKKDIAIVIGFQGEKVIEHLGEEYNYCIQDKQLGTAHAAMCTRELFHNCDDDVIIIYGDMPLINMCTLKSMIDKHKETNADMTILTAVVKNILPYGRIIRDNNKVIDIIEEKDTDDSTRAINELNVGVNVIKLKYLYDGLDSIKNNNAAGEYYLTDLAKAFVKQGKKVETFTIHNEDEIRGINTVEDLEFAAGILQKK